MAIPEGYNGADEVLISGIRVSIAEVLEGAWDENQDVPLSMELTAMVLSGIPERDVKKLGAVKFGSWMIINILTDVDISKLSPRTVEALDTAKMLGAKILAITKIINEKNRSSRVRRSRPAGGKSAPESDLPGD